MMGCPFIIYHSTRHSGVDHSQQSQQASKEIPQRNTVDPIRYLAVLGILK